MENLQEIKEKLIKYKIKPSLIRIKVYEFLKNTREHPDAEKIYNELKKEIPTLSRTSIYNALKVLVKNRVIKEVMIEEDEIRYDGFNDRHAHFKCIKCKKIYDIELKCDSCLNNIKLKNAKIIDEHIYFIGICENCNKTKGVKDGSKRNKK